MPRRTRSPHPGVVLLKPDPAGRHPHWRARYEAPDTGRTTKETIDPVAVRTAEQRRTWAIAKSKALAKRRLELEGGAPRTTGTAFDDAIDQYFTDHKRLRPKTIEAYEGAADKLRAWAKRTGVHSADDLTGPRLAAFRQELVKEKKSVRLKGRTARTKGDVFRSPHTVNREIRSVGTVLEYLRGLGLLPKLTGDGLRDALKKERAPLDAPEFLKQPAIRALLTAALAHDAETFAATRDEHAGKGKPGTTPRYPAIAPFAAFLLLTGMRRNEALAIDWGHVTLGKESGEGEAAGEIVLTAAMTKTHRGRKVGFDVSPGLRALLAAMHKRAGGKGRVFSLTEGEARSAARRLMRDFDAPAFGWHMLRATCGCFLTCAPGIYSGASAYRSAKRLGHSVAIAERHYVDVVHVPKDATTLEDAMQIGAELVTALIESAKARA